MEDNVTIVTIQLPTQHHITTAQHNTAAQHNAIKHKAKLQFNQFSTDGGL